MPNSGLFEASLEPGFSAQGKQFTMLCTTIRDSFQWDRLAFRKPDPSQ